MTSKEYDDETKLSFQLLGNCEQYKNLPYPELKNKITEINTI